MVRKPMLPRLMLVTDRARARGRDLVDVVVAAARGGLRLIQVREPDLSDDALRELVRRLQEAVPAGTRLVVNGRPRVARTLRAGLHLPARAPFGSRVPLHGEPYGRSAHDEAEARRATEDDVDYIVLGTIYPTPSHPGRRGGGPALVERICQKVRPVPVYAIGGIAVARVPEVIHAGAHGVAVSRALLEANDPARVAEALNLALEVATRGPA